MENSHIILLKHSYQKLEKAVHLVRHSVQKIEPYDSKLCYSPDQLEPFDALTGRFERSVEIALNKFFRSVELVESKVLSDTIRDRLNVMNKLDLISDVELWLDMRDIRNRIAFDYLPEKIEKIYHDIIFKFSLELDRLMKKNVKFLKKEKFQSNPE